MLSAFTLSLKQQVFIIWLLAWTWENPAASRKVWVFKALYEWGQCGGESVRVR